MKPNIELTMVKCCSTCILSAGWMDNMQCVRHRIEVRPHWICKDYDENKHMSKVEIFPLSDFKKRG